MKAEQEIRSSYSSSVIDTFTAVRSAFDYLTGLKLHDNYFLLNFLVVACVVGKKFTQHLTERLRLDLGLSDNMIARDENLLSPLHVLGHIRKLSKDDKENSSVIVDKNAALPFSLLPSHCLALNNNEMARVQMNDFAENAERILLERHGPGHIRKLSKDDKENSSVIVDKNAALPFSLLPSHCLALNNNEMARVQMNDFAENAERILLERHGHNMRGPDADTDGFFGPTLRAMKEERVEVLKSLYEKISTYLRQEMNNSCMNPKVNPSHSPKFGAGNVIPTAQYDKARRKLIDHLDSQLSTLTEHVSEDLFKITLKYFWDSIVVDLTSMIFPQESGRPVMKDEEAKRLILTLKDLEQLFHANGSGIPKAKLAEKTSEIEKLLLLCGLPTRDLISICNRLRIPESAKKSNISRGGTFTEFNLDGLKVDYPVQILRSRTLDKVAVSFLQELDDPQQHLKQQNVRHKYLLTDSELIIETVRATYEKTPGLLLLTSSYLIFDPLISGKGADDDLVLLLTQLTSVVRIKKTGLKIVESLILQDEQKETYTFTAWNVKIIHEDLLSAAKAAGNNHLVHLPPPNPVESPAALSDEEGHN
eukprot:TRINITY_DN5434_c0_g1_i1.p1 TRINITY_DN5434_c0_g1~~TRINITY_DN5434_c0_g1_i1.p1  ORF type:complete len:630 (+),score=235.40 TRINITY_DN5434_c0_g1_i1:116-1891(+)